MNAAIRPILKKGSTLAGSIVITAAQCKIGHHIRNGGGRNIGRHKEHLEIEAIRLEMEKGPLFVKLKTAARILNVSYQTMWRLVHYGKIDAIKLAGVWRIPRQALIEYLESRHFLNLED